MKLTRLEILAVIVAILAPVIVGGCSKFHATVSPDGSVNVDAEKQKP